MDGSLPEVFWQTKETIHWRTSPCNAWPHETLLDQVRCLKIRFRGGTYPAGLKQRQTPMCIYLEDILSNWEKLRNLWSGVISNHSSTRRVETLHSRVPTHDSHLFWSQESDLLPWSKETEQETSAMVSLPVRIQHQAYPHFGQQNDSVWYAFLKTRLHTWRGQRQRGYYNVAQQFVYQLDWFGPPETYC